MSFFKSIVAQIKLILGLKDKINSFSMTKKYYWIFFTIFFLQIAKQGFCQIGGNGSFSFLNIPSNPIQLALGGVNVSRSEKDVNVLFQNPALLDSSLHNLLAVNYTPYFSGINYATAAYARKFKENIIALGVQSINYGNFQLTDASGNILGQFAANDVAMTLSSSRTQGNITFGGSLKFASSVIESYSAVALLMDFGAIFKHPTQALTLGLTVKNVGVTLKSYTPFDKTDLPFDVQAGISFKPKYMPVRFSFTAHHLYQYDISYLDKSIIKKDLNGNVIENKISPVDNFARHFVIGAELLLSKNFHALIGYNHLRSAELSQQNVSGFSGFSLGFLIHTKLFNFSYGYSGYNTAGNLNSFGLVCDLNRIIK
ncbi:type IX secretion system protein PorQ [Arcicella lustrica]|uniref:Type IX secretion system protein PorQ n=1 Tax=Arcicella lustrica TaxID=2984196 RepID=A0ABU5SQP2_9BACT|nr:type IX secretion system protein PorQ [Arcicella sp. DC25W]MEA5429597.1 type IX secretion system protein PorQ [Arcicella sp. DC25W]